MATSAALVFFVALLLAVSVPLVVYALADEEAENTRRMDRRSAEEVARRDTDESEGGD